MGNQIQNELVTVGRFEREFSEGFIPHLEEEEQDTYSSWLRGQLSPIILMGSILPLLPSLLGPPRYSGPTSQI